MSAVYEQQREAIATNAVATIAKSIKEQYAPFFKHHSADSFQRAYNPSTGNSFEGLNSLMLDIKQAEKKYPSNEWISLNDAKFLGAKLEEINAIKENWQDKAVKIQYIQKNEYVNVLKKDEQGNPIPLLDKDNNQRIGKNGEPLYQFEMVTQKDAKGNAVINPKTNEPYLKIKTELVPLKEPKLQTELMYNIAEFPSLAQKLNQVKEVWNKMANGEQVNGNNITGFNKFKELDKEKEFSHIYKNLKNYEAKVSKVILQDIESRLNPVTAEQIQQYFKAQNLKVDYQVPKGLNERQKQEVQNLIDNGAIKLDVKQQENAKEAKNTEQKESKAQEHTQEKAQEKTNKPKSKARGR
ncbi:DUF1738 domain-containing protein [Helicobacter cinaedi]|uniref:N-terminal domain-containing protein n=1 Tax=Helicobacter cinaedi CCUG 18818 = ATCC BAA-847 TaxID=537971 RepID=A0AAI8QHW6_9HELI|nr:ArdC-like ssDNA-binding domain-containing protein [Helicobacter cinaedi]EFR45880.1 hypothetical protein HCCG_00426 [Helicobacter cinaedi CCUG 18818 = ATCC BAA-847]QOQ90857.1 DUF1738 domain-containing protein [Helicobacter cinaedi]BAM33240.1 hypothetical protein HCBAA847_2022 [Helicobacter cinaedi CCUG 18818 = ATCC BAA-847]